MKAHEDREIPDALDLNPVVSDSTDTQPLVFGPVLAKLGGVWHWYGY